MDANESVLTPVLVERGEEEAADAGDEKPVPPTSASAPQRSIWDANWDTWVGGRAATHSTRVLLLVRRACLLNRCQLIADASPQMATTRMVAALTGRASSPPWDACRPPPRATACARDWRH